METKSRLLKDINKDLYEIYNEKKRSAKRDLKKTPKQEEKEKVK